MFKHFQLTGPDETVLPVIYIEKYKDEHIQQLFKEYKFSNKKDRKYVQARRYFEQLVSDFVVNTKCNLLDHPDTLYLFTAPPSTTYAKKERSGDIVRELFQQIEDLYSSVFSIRLDHLKHAKAQHLEKSSRKSRLAKSKGKYTISWKFKLKISYYIKYKTVRRFYIGIIDDVCSTGGTLLACRDTLEQYFLNLQKKKPEVQWTIQAFSLSH